MRKLGWIMLLAGIISLLIISFVTSRKVSWFWMCIEILLLLFIVRIVPVCRKHENVWLFILTAIVSIPINIKITEIITFIGLFNSGIPYIGPVVAVIETYLLLLAIEELIVGVIGRLIWKRQYKISIE